MVLSKTIEDAIEEEVNARVNARITQVLEIISRNYNIRYQRLLNDLATCSGVPSPSTTCCGTVKNGKRCQKPGKHDGYCKIHLKQKPDIREVTPPPQKEGVIHTHTLPPLFLAGCPACEASKRNSTKIL
jgi:Family of unknown function (DUF5763)